MEYPCHVEGGRWWSFNMFAAEEHQHFRSTIIIIFNVPLINLHLVVVARDSKRENMLFRFLKL